jgi:opacity protein-like surface antigen
MIHRILLTAALITLMFTQIFAQMASIGPQLGFQKAQDADEGKFMGGLKMRMSVLPALSVEASVNYRAESYYDGGLKVSSWPIMITALIYPIPIVYGAIGMGWYNTSFTYDHNRLPFSLYSDDTQQKVGWHFGGGVDIPVGSNMTLTADIRYVFINYDFQSIPGSGEVSSDFYVFSVSLLFGL